MAPLKAAYKAARKAGAQFFIVDHDPPFHGKTALETANVDYAYVAGVDGAVSQSYRVLILEGAASPDRIEKEFTDFSKVRPTCPAARVARK